MKRQHYHPVLDENETPWRLAAPIIAVLAIGGWVLLGLASCGADRLVGWLTGA